MCTKIDTDSGIPLGGQQSLEMVRDGREVTRDGKKTASSVSCCSLLSGIVFVIMFGCCYCFACGKNTKVGFWIIVHSHHAVMCQGTVKKHPDTADIVQFLKRIVSTNHDDNADHQPLHTSKFVSHPLLPTSRKRQGQQMTMLHVLSFKRG